MVRDDVTRAARADDARAGRVGATATKCSSRRARWTARLVAHHVEHARGSLARPLTDDELMDKVRLLVDPLLGNGTAAQLAAVVDGLDAARQSRRAFRALHFRTRN